MVDIGDISGSQDRHITAGLEYGDSGYIWVGQAKVTTKATLKTMDVSIFQCLVLIFIFLIIKQDKENSMISLILFMIQEFPLKVEYTDGDIPTELAKGDSTVIQLTMYLTNPNSPIKFEAFQPNGYDVIQKIFLSLFFQKIYLRKNDHCCYEIHFYNIYISFRTLSMLVKSRHNGDPTACLKQVAFHAATKRC